MSDISGVWENFFSQRTKPLFSRFNGCFRGLVVETNDPLRMHRIRFIIPELHDSDLKQNPEQCPWAVPATDPGWWHPCIGDIVWIEFEKNHPYGPIYTAIAPPTRRGMYELASIYGSTPRPIDINAADPGDHMVKFLPQPDDFNPDYMPKDERPMSRGWQDRYGSMDVHDAVGYFPKSHERKPPNPDMDGLSRANFEQSQKPPEVNNPDSKMMFRLSKYGMLFLQADIGYKWKKSGDEGEFSGNPDDDEDFEIKRWKYMQRLLHEDEPTERDQRRIECLTRYGMKWEMRDVGWNKTRAGEWDDAPRTIGDGNDERWIKIRTKGGMLFEACDIGFDPEEDTFVKRLLIDEIDTADELLDKEDKFPKIKTDWNKSGDRDARFIRLVSRSGLKIAIDDRGSHDQSAEASDRKNKELGTGVLIKGRATPGTSQNYQEASGNSKGYYWQFDEHRNSTTWGTPLGQAIELDDDNEYLAICSRLPQLPEVWQYLSGNEFLTKSVQSLDPAHNTHHIVIDHGNEVIRFKSRAGHGDKSRKPGIIAATGEFAGLEVHDAPQDDPWTELVDIDKRGIWFSRKDGVSVWRAKEGTNIYITLDDKNNNIVIKNSQTGGKVQIYCEGNIEVVSNQTIGFKGKTIQFDADNILFGAKGAKLSIANGVIDTNADIKAANIYGFFPTIPKPTASSGNGVGAKAGSGQAALSNLTVVVDPSRLQPTDRL